MTIYHSNEKGSEMIPSLFVDRETLCFKDQVLAGAAGAALLGDAGAGGTAGAA